MINQTKNGVHVIYYQQQLNKHTTTWNLRTFFFSHTHNKMKKYLSIFLYQAQNLQSLFFYLQKMESVCEIEAHHIALNSGLVWRWDDKIHNYTITNTLLL